MNSLAASEAGIDRQGIAIVGIGCRFPGESNDPQRLWANLVAGFDAISEVPPQRWAIERFFHPRKGAAGKSATRWGGFVEDIDRFDAEFFNISPREAMLMDPQQRMLLEVCWEALEDGGCVPSHWSGRPVGVFVGGFTLDYMVMQLGGADYRSVEPHTATGSMMTLLSNRLSYAFGFNGPSLSVDTACSSSLVAVHLACRSLLAGESQLAIAGGVNALLTPSYTVAESRAGMLSPTGRSKAFDSRADGYVRGEGAGLVVLKTLESARRDGDHVYAVIRASAVNQDGHSDGLTVPSGEAQSALMRGALLAAGVRPHQLSYVEAHGTGTPVGDPIEAAAIGSVVREGRDEGQRCLLGSIKTNIGHTEAAAGVAGLIKTALVLAHRKVPPHLHLLQANPKIDLPALGLRIPADTVDLPDSGVLHAAVNSFGFGGTNAHAILACADLAEVGGDDAEPPEPPPFWILPLSARNADSLHAAAARLADALAPSVGLVAQQAHLRDVCDTAAMRREQHPHRACVIGEDASELIAGLQALAERQAHAALAIGDGPAPAAAPPLTYVYSGMGPQWWAMGRALYETEPVFRAAFDRCTALFEAMAGWSLHAAMSADEAASRMADTQVAQPANFVLQVALTELLAHWGVRPQAIVGHSAGEPAAAYAAGVLSLEDAMEVIYHRSRLQQTTTGQGRLLAVGLSADAARSRIAALGEPSLSLAAINGPAAVTVVGVEAAIERLQAELLGEGVFVRALQVQVPYHSVFMEPLRQAMLDALAGIAPREASIPLYSTVSGARVQGPELDAEYWYRNVRQPVEFLRAIEALADAGHASFLEIGPHPVLSGSIREVMTMRGVGGATVHCLRRDTPEPREMRRALAALHVQGVRIDWRAAQGAGHWVRLPTYPWRDTRFWHETPASRDSRTAPPEHPILARRIEAASPTWEVDLEAPRLGFLADHEIQGVVVFPGAGYIEMAAHAGRSLYGSLDAMEFEDVRFTKALYLSPDQLQTLRITIEPATHDFVIASRPYGVERAGWHVHCTGRLRLSQAAGEPAADLAALQAQCPHEVARSACYEHFRTLGLEYGSSFQGIARLWQGDGQALARVEVPAELHATLADFNAHPAVLDVCFQTLAAALPMQQGASMVYMPTGVSAGRCHRPLATRMWIHAQITERDASGMAGNIMLYDDDGEPVIRIHQCRARALGDQGQAAATPQKLYQPDWIEQERGAPRNEPQPGVWLVHGGSAELSAATLAALRQAGNTALAVHDDKGFRVSAQGLHVNGVDESSWLQLLVHAQQAGEVRGVVRLDAQDDPVPAAGPVAECIDRAMSRSCLVTLALAKALTKVEAAARPRLWIVTRGTQCAGGQPVANPLDAGVWGLGRVLGHGEHIDIWGGMIDLCLRPTAGEGALIAAECVQGDGEDQIAWRGAQRYVMRLHECPAEVALPTAPQLRANATYLVTGGLGALGLVVSKWMVEHGARHLMLLGREGLPPRDRWRDDSLPQAVRSRIAAVRDIEASGASVRIEALDIADRAALESLVTAHEQAGYPPIRGVIHAAGVAKPQLSAQMSAEEFKSVWPAKVLGAWNLHGVFSGPGRRLDFFTLFSSVASLVISMGQGNYAAANACLDALAHWRRAAGLPAVSINWGPWGDVGMATQLDLLKLFHNRGFFPMTAVQGCQALGQLMSGRAGQAVVLGAHWKTVGDTSPLGIPAPMLEHLIRDEAASAQATPGKAASGVSFLTGYRACETPEGRRELLTDHLRALACRVLRVEESALGTDDTLHSHGMDSMMAIELKNRIEQSTKVRVAIVDLLKGASVHALADMVAPEIDAIHGNVTGALAEIVDAMQELRAEEIDALLAQEEAAQEAAAAEEMK